jgi:formylglycine-generating enzyme required for sulfatase activity
MEPRPQLLLIVDTNTPLVAQVVDDPDLAQDAAVDTLRVDFLESDELPREIVAPDPRDWPISFGVVAERSVRLRLRLFRASLARAGGGDEPIAEATIERIVELVPSSDGVKRVRVTLDGECFGTRSVFTKPMLTCLGKGHLAVSPDAGIATGEAAEGASLVGTWAEARARGCEEQPKPGRVCIQGGFTILGDSVLIGLEAGLLASSPLQPVVIPPFWMDETEMSVGRFRELAAQVSPGPKTATGTGELAHCKWIDASTPSNDDYPLNCLGYDSAELACSLFGGTLPSEAQWEHAARGRGQARIYPWGDTPPECCTASFHRAGIPGPVLCNGVGPEVVGSHATNECVDHDVSRDGVLDLGGSVSEFMRDSAVPFHDVCWEHAGIPHNPVCSSPGVGPAVRGGSWGNGLRSVQSAVRLTPSLWSSAMGFRCVYEEGQ